MSLTVNYDQLKDKVVEAAIAAFHELSNQLQGDKIAAICLHTDDGAMRAGIAFAPQSFLDKVGELFDWPHWPLSGGADSQFNEICDILTNNVLSSGEPKSVLLVQVMATLVSAANDIRQQIAPDDPAFILLVDTDATLDVLEGQEERLKRLNSPEVFEQFLNWQNTRSKAIDRSL